MSSMLIGERFVDMLTAIAMDGVERALGVWPDVCGLYPSEEVDLPVFFFIDPMLGKEEKESMCPGLACVVADERAADWTLYEDSRFDHVDRISLSYVFFESDSELPDEYKERPIGSFGHCSIQQSAGLILEHWSKERGRSSDQETGEVLQM
eukprot:1442447-Amphidinium_carterae.1